MAGLIACALLVGAATAQEIFDQKTDILKARCRAHCLNKFYMPEMNTNCRDDADCWMCWDSCHMLYGGFRVWGHMCGKDPDCMRFPGCQESCSFVSSHLDSLTQEGRSDTKAIQPLKHHYLSEKDAFHFEWTRPKEDYQIGQLVYALLVRDELSGGWQQLQQTFYHNATVRRSLIKSSSYIRLTSYDSEGRTAEVEKPCSELNLYSEDANIEGMYKDTAMKGMPPGYTSRHRELSLDYLQDGWVPVLQSLRASSMNSGGVDAVISWEQVSHKAAVKYVVEWKQPDQNIDMTGQLATSNNMGVLTLWPNKIYQLTITAFVPGIRDPVGRSRALVINTAKHVSGLWISVSYIELVVMTAVLLFVIVLSVVAQTYRRCLRADTVTATQAVHSTTLNLPFRHASVKKQLSSLSTRISQKPLKHDRLIEEDSPYSLGHRANDCNI
ncbi:uncharacterized protein LOC111254354 [Varroa destructor]|uniref:Uncharacterized protein n=1 Tax=Varroa destructor TaxID=109461 RepID=A0A7M7MJE0_VARDE|nr:uncharacterized protein LOC111254354 [Varroa destructor]